MQQVNAQIFTNASMATTIHSNPVYMEQEWMVSIQAIWSGTPSGTFTIETSCDVGSIDTNTGLGTGVTNWTTYTGSSQDAGSAAGQFVWRIANFPDKWVRLTYTAVSGSGTVNARFNAKG